MIYVLRALLGGVLRLAWEAALVIPALLVCGFGAVAAYALRRPIAWVDACYRGFCRVTLFACGARVEAGGGLLLPTRPAVVVCNHESNLDGPSLVVALHERSVRFVIKRELLRVPVLGWALASTGSVPVARGQHGASGLALVERLRDAAVDVVFFAEGTRSKDGRLRGFKKGAFHYAIATGRPVVPAAVGGALEVLPSGSVRGRRGTLAVRFGDPIPTDGLQEDDLDALRERTFAAVAALREEALAAARSPRAVAERSLAAERSLRRLLRSRA